MDIVAFRTGMFEFACGGRMVGLFPEWHQLTVDDLDHVCSRTDVTTYCLDWCRSNLDFGDICSQVTALANGNFTKEHKKWMKMIRKNANSVNASVVLSGCLDLANLQLRSPSVRKSKEKVEEIDNLHAIVQALQLAWDGHPKNQPTTEAAVSERAIQLS
jgi:hypothetical protein